MSRKTTLRALLTESGELPADPSASPEESPAAAFSETPKATERQRGPEAAGSVRPNEGQDVSDKAHDDAIRAIEGVSRRESAKDSPTKGEIGRQDLETKGSSTSGTAPSSHHAARARGAGVVRAMGLELSRMATERDVSADERNSRVLEIDPELIAPSPVRDRLDSGDHEAVASLRDSIAEHGQHVPILVREERDTARGTLYRIAFGHRRWAACRLLGRSVRAVIADLDDEALLLAQGQENAERRDLTFIERAGFAAALDRRGLSRRMIGEALGCDKTETSRLLAVSRLVPPEIVQAIGRAPKAGRPRWTALGRALDETGRARADAAINAQGFAHHDTDRRFEMVRDAVLAKKEAAGSVTIEAKRDGKVVSVATLEASGKTPRLVIAPEWGSPFARWLADRLPDLAEEWNRNHKSDGEDRG